VVDSSDWERFDESRDELHSVMNHDEMRGVPVVVMANKQDLPGILWFLTFFPENLENCVF